MLSIAAFALHLHTHRRTCSIHIDYTRIRTGGRLSRAAHLLVSKVHKVLASAHATSPGAVKDLS